MNKKFLCKKDLHAFKEGKEYLLLKEHVREDGIVLICFLDDKNREFDFAKEKVEFLYYVGDYFEFPSRYQSYADEQEISAEAYEYLFKEHFHDHLEVVAKGAALVTMSQAMEAIRIDRKSR